jgi:hypothetical protein
MEVLTHRRHLRAMGCRAHDGSAAGASGELFSSPD